jgi:hypothetical protein
VLGELAGRAAGGAVSWGMPIAPTGKRALCKHEGALGLGVPRHRVTTESNITNLHATVARHDTAQGAIKDVVAE